MAIVTDTVEEIKRDVARAVGGLIYNGTADSGTSSTLVHDELKRFVNDDALKGKEIDLVGGTGVGEELQINAFTSASGTNTVVPNFTTTPDNTTRYHIYDPAVVTARLLEELIAEAVTTLTRHRFLATSNRKLILNDVAAGRGDFETYSTTNVPDNWTLDANSTFTQETTAAKVRYGSSSLKVVSDGTNIASAIYSVEPHYRFAGSTFTAKMWGWSATASRVFVRGAYGTDTDSSNHGGDSKWEDLASASFTATDPSKLTLECRVSAGSAVTAYFDHARLISGSDVWEYTLPSGLVAISEILVEGNTEDKWSHLRIPSHLYSVDRTNSLLIIDRQKFSGYGDRRLHINGISALTVPTTDSSTVEAPEYVKAYCRYRILDMLKNTSVERLGFAKRAVDEEFIKARRLPNARDLKWIER